MASVDRFVVASLNDLKSRLFWIGLPICLVSSQSIVSLTINPESNACNWWQSGSDRSKLWYWTMWYVNGGHENPLTSNSG